MIKKCIFLLLFCFLFLFNKGISQTSIFKPFTLIIIEPDTALLDPALKKNADSMEQQHLQQYYSSLKQMESLSQDSSYDAEFRKKVGNDALKKHEEGMQAQLVAAKKNEAQMKQFKYYQSISEFSASVYEYYFNELPPFEIIKIVKNKNWNNASLKQIADSMKADYVIAYKNIHSDVYNALPVLKMTTVVYANNENKIILEKESIGDSGNTGGIWECNNPLNCMLANIVKTSFRIAYPVISQRQKK